MALEALTCCPITCDLGEDANPHLTIISFQEYVESSKISPEPPLLQAEVFIGTPCSTPVV